MNERGKGIIWVYLLVTMLILGSLLAYIRFRWMAERSAAEFDALRERDSSMRTSEYTN